MAATRTRTVEGGGASRRDHRCGAGGVGAGYLLITLAVESAAADALGAKEAIVMAVEPLGGVQVLSVEARWDEQLELDGVPQGSRNRPPASVDCGPPAAPGGRAAANGPSAAQRRRSPCRTGMACCMTCDFYRQEPGKDERGKVRWGTCGQTGGSVYRLIDRCGSYVRVQT